MKITTNKLVYFIMAIIAAMAIVYIDVSSYRLSKIPSEKDMRYYYQENNILFNDIKDQLIDYNGFNGLFIYFKNDSIESDNYDFIKYLETNTILKNNLENYFRNTILDHSNIYCRVLDNGNKSIIFRAIYRKLLNNYFETGISFNDSGKDIDEYERSENKMEDQWYYYLFGCV